MIGVTLLDNSQSARDHRVSLHGTWEAYELVLALKGDRTTPRIAYLDGEIEIVSPTSSAHECVKEILATLFVHYCFEHRLTVQALGSWTVKRKSKRAAAEPDACYVFGRARKPRPDLAIEVVRTSGGVSKLEIYRRLAVPEVWIWKHGALTVHVLARGTYRVSERSRFVPDLDLELMNRLAQLQHVTDALRRWRRALQA